MEYDVRRTRIRITLLLSMAVLLAGAALSGCSAASPVHGRAAAAAMTVRPGTMTDISGCGGSNAEVEEAFAPPGYVYAEWIGCHGIGFARSADGGRTWSAAVRVPGSAGSSWDPAIATGPEGTVYVAYMHSAASGGSTIMYPQVAVSVNHGARFTRVYKDLPPVTGNWGDRDFIAVGPNGRLYLTWDYGPSAAKVKLLCAKSGSCAYSHGDLNVVIQTSSDGGKTWGPITHLAPGFPAGGGYGAPLIVAPGGSVDVIYDDHPTAPGTLALQPGHEYFTSSPDGMTWPAAPLMLWPDRGALSLPTWWIDGDIAADAGGTLYATWDTQTSAGDLGWLTWSSDGGRSWASPVRVTPDTNNAPHIVEVAGGPAGTAYVAWQTSGSGPGYQTYLRPFSVRHGWLAPVTKVSAQDGAVHVWPGDTFGIAVLPGGRVSLTWGSTTGTNKTSSIYSSLVSLG
jgi:hypothetical protein